MAHCYGPDKVVTRLQQVCSKKWIGQELSFLDPRLYIIIGKRSANFFFPDRDFTELVFENLVWKKWKAFVLPHPSPANQKWFKNNPKFESDRLSDIRKAVHEAIQPKENV
jgi:uracil-DNA glycosylase